MSAPLVNPDDVREFIADYAENNHLLDGEEFSDTRIALATELAMSEFNMIPPIGGVSVDTFLRTGKTVVMCGILWKLFSGQAALLARNHMSYSDGGINIPVEERMELYLRLSDMYRSEFVNSATNLKRQLNLEAGFGEVSGDAAFFPNW